MVAYRATPACARPPVETLSRVAACYDMHLKTRQADRNIRISEGGSSRDYWRVEILLESWRTQRGHKDLVNISRGQMLLETYLGVRCRSRNVPENFSVPNQRFSEFRDSLNSNCRRESPVQFITQTHEK